MSNQVHTQVNSQLPYPLQDRENMPIPYGAMPLAPYPNYMSPPMPTTFNPYSTLSYPSQGN